MINVGELRNAIRSKRYLFLVCYKNAMEDILSSGIVQKNYQPLEDIDSDFFVCLVEEPFYLIDGEFSNLINFEEGIYVMIFDKTKAMEQGMKRVVYKEHFTEDNYDDPYIERTNFAALGRWLYRDNFNIKDSYIDFCELKFVKESSGRWVIVDK